MTKGPKTAIAVGVMVLLLCGFVLFEIFQWFGNGGATTAFEITHKPSQTSAANGSNYTAEISTEVPAGFSGGILKMTQLGSRPYIGQVDAQPITFTLSHMPPHALVHVTFDLALFDSWNGCNTRWGPDIWMCGLDGGPELVRTTFSNCGMFEDNNEQNFPDQFPLPPGATSHPAWIGSREHATLGQTRSWGDDTFDVTSIYRMDWTFPHTDSTLKLNFSQKVRERDKLFGFLSFHVEALPALMPLSDDQFKNALADIESNDPVAANTAVWRLIGSGDLAVQKLKGQNLSTLTDFPLARVQHVLQVVDTSAARELAKTLPASAGN